MDEEVPRLAGLGVGALLCASGTLVALVTRRAADGRLRRNHLAGLRTPATLRSDAAWREGHAAAVPLSDLAGGAFAISGMVALTAPSEPVYAAVLLGGVLVGTGLLLLSARRAGRVASAAE